MSTMLNSPPTRDIQSLAEWLKILADPTRLRIFNLLMEGVQCNCEFSDQLHLPRNLISHHLNILRQAGLVDMERDPLDARWIYYSINPAVLADLNRAFGTFFNPNRIQPRRAYCGPQAILSNPAKVNITNPA